MNLKARAFEASKKRKIENDQKNATCALKILKERLGTIGEIDGECVIVAAETDDELKFQFSNRYGGRGDVKVWHNDAWHEVYSLEGLGDCFFLSKSDLTPQTTTEQLVELLEEAMYGIAQEALDNR